MALIIAGERSGAGKTTTTLALLAALHRQRRSVQSFKVGPDYIDPMFHRYITGRACRNLDPVLTSPTYVQQCFQQHIQQVDYGIVEGVMGLFDGATGADDWASTAHIARLLQVPVLLVLDCSRLSRSIAAIAHGFQTFDPRIQFAGLVLNRVGSDRHLDLLQTALESIKLPILGILRRQDTITIPDRHLGLIPTAELPELDRVIDRLAALGEACFDWRTLLPMLEIEERQKTEGRTQQQPPSLSPSLSFPLPLRIAIAYDQAFSFYYADNLERLEQLGAELVFWSPLQDAQMPEAQGLYFGGGFPEVFAEQLSANQAARASVRQAIEAGMPTYAECGGLMYLAEHLIDFQGRTWEMVGVLPTTARMENRLTLGYRQSIALRDSPLVATGEIVWGHEFHRSALLPQLTELDRSLYRIRGYDSQSLSIEEDDCIQEGFQIHQVHASYVHLHWGAKPEIPARFLRSCLTFAQKMPKVDS